MARLSKEKEALLRAVQKQAARKKLAAEQEAAERAAVSSSQVSDILAAGMATSGNAVQAGAEQGIAGAHDARAKTEQESAGVQGVQTTSEAGSSNDARPAGSSEQKSKQDSGASDSSKQTNMRSAATVGLGVDLLEIDRMERALERTPRIAERVFTSNEREYAWSKARPAVQYAAFFAAREAVLKALGTGFAGVDFTDVEIVHDEKGKPEVVLHNNAEAIARSQGIVEIQISLSHTHHMAVASAVAIKEQSSPPKNEHIDPMEELTRRFKELRSLIDDIGAGELLAADGLNEDAAEDANVKDESSDAVSTNADSSDAAEPLAEEALPIASEASEAEHEAPADSFTNESLQEPDAPELEE